MAKAEKSGEVKNELAFDADFDLWVLLDQTRFAISRARELELNQYDITPVQAAVLFALLNCQGSATLIEIAKFTMRQHNSVSNLINRMVKQGLVRKVKSSKSDNIRVVITEKGKRVYHKATMHSIQMIFSSLPAEDKERLNSYLHSLRTKARSLLGLDYKPPFLPE